MNRDDTNPNEAARPEDDPRLSAYAMGHLDAEEAAEVEAWLERDEEARRVVEELRRVMRSLEREFAAEAPVGLRDEQRERIQ